MIVSAIILSNSPPTDQDHFFNARRRGAEIFDRGLMKLVQCPRGTASKAEAEDELTLLQTPPARSDAYRWKHIKIIAHKVSLKYHPPYENRTSDYIKKTRDKDPF